MPQEVPSHFHQPGLVTWSGMAALSNEARAVYVQRERAFRQLTAHLREDPQCARLWIPTAEIYRKMDISTRPMHPMHERAIQRTWGSMSAAGN